VGFQLRCEDVNRRRRSDVLPVADCSRHEQRRPGRVEFGGQSVMKTRPSAVAVEPRDQLVGRNR